MGRITHTYVLLEISEAAYLEIKEKLEKAGYQHAFHENPDAPASPRIDMHGIAVVPEVEMTQECTCYEVEFGHQPGCPYHGKKS